MKHTKKQWISRGQACGGGLGRSHCDRDRRRDRAARVCYGCAWCGRSDKLDRRHAHPFGAAAPVGIGQIQRRTRGTTGSAARHVIAARGHTRSAAGSSACHADPARGRERSPRQGRQLGPGRCDRPGHPGRNHRLHQPWRSPVPPAPRQRRLKPVMPSHRRIPRSTLHVDATARLLPTSTQALAWLERNLDSTVGHVRLLDCHVQHRSLLHLVDCLTSLWPHRHHYRTSLELARMGEQAAQATMPLQTGTVLTAIGEHEQARRALDCSQILYVACGDRLGDADARLSGGELFRACGQHDDATREILTALALYEHLDARHRATLAPAALGATHLDAAHHPAGDGMAGTGTGRTGTGLRPRTPCPGPSADRPRPPPYPPGRRDHRRHRVRPRPRTGADVGRTSGAGAAAAGPSRSGGTATAGRGLLERAEKSLAAAGALHRTRVHRSPAARPGTAR
ncbi:hypothetical protein LV78_005427 [Actinosynnema pretiosum]|nr:hypothetical protein [Actinosynnema pretiosum]